MKQTAHVVLAAVAAGVASMAAVPAIATNGYYSHGYGTISQGMAGAGVAMGQDSLATATNPAGMAFVGSRLDGGVELFSPRREYGVSGGDPAQAMFFLTPGEHSSDNKAFFIPHFGINYQLDERQTLGLSVYANGGMNTEWGGADTFYSGTAGVDLEQLFISPTYTYRLNERHAIGVAPVVVHQRFKATGLAAFAPFSADPTALSDNGTDTAWGYGFHVGWEGELGDSLRAGMSWRSIIDMQEFSDYAGLFAEQGGFDIPTMLNAGLAWSPSAQHWLLLDVQHIRYSEIDSVGNPLLPNLQQAALGSDEGAGFGWRNMTVYKLGWQWAQSERQTWRAGISYGRQPIPDSEVLFNILAPGVQEWHFSAGMTRHFDAGLELSGMAFFSPEKTVTGENPLAPGQEIELSMYQLGVGLNLGWSF